MIALFNGAEPRGMPGDLEYGPVLYLIDTQLKEHHPTLLALLEALGLPATKVTKALIKKVGGKLETTGIIAPERTREAVFKALKQRHTMAATGDRIRMVVNSNGAIMGDALKASDPRTFEIEVDPLGPLEFVQVLKNGEPVQIWQGPRPRRESEAGTFAVREL